MMQYTIVYSGYFSQIILIEFKWNPPRRIEILQKKQKSVLGTPSLRNDFLFTLSVTNATKSNWEERKDSISIYVNWCAIRMQRKTLNNYHQLIIY